MFEQKFYCNKKYNNNNNNNDFKCYKLLAATIPLPITAQSVQGALWYILCVTICQSVLLFCCFVRHILHDSHLYVSFLSLFKYVSLFFYSVVDVFVVVTINTKKIFQALHHLHIKYSSTTAVTDFFYFFFGFFFVVVVFVSNNHCNKLGAAL